MRLSWEWRGGVLRWFFAHRKQMLPALVFFFPRGRALLHSWPLAQRVMEESQLPTSTFSETLLAPSLDTMCFCLGLQQLCKGVKGQSRCLGDSPRDIKGNVHAGFSPTPQPQMSLDVHLPGALIPSCLPLHFCHGRSWLHSQLFPGIWLKATQLKQGHQ